MLCNRYRYITCNAAHAMVEHTEDIDAIDVTGFFANIVDHTLYIKVEHDGTYEIFEHNVGPLVMLRQLVFELYGADDVYIIEQPKDVTIPPQSYMQVVVSQPDTVTYQWQYSNNLISWTDITTSSGLTSTLTIWTATQKYRRCLITTSTGHVIISAVASITSLEEVSLYDTD